MEIDGSLTQTQKSTLWLLFGYKMGSHTTELIGDYENPMDYGPTLWLFTA